VGNQREVVTTRTAGFNWLPFGKFEFRAVRQRQHVPQYGGKISYQGLKAHPCSKLRGVSGGLATIPLLAVFEIAA
jgi:hypothetical protein